MFARLDDYPGWLAVAASRLASYAEYILLLVFSFASLIMLPRNTQREDSRNK